MGEATVAVVGRVVSSEPFYNNFGEIYTKHVLALDRTLANDHARNPASEIEFFTPGGVINEEQLIVSPSVTGIHGADGLFLLTEYSGNRVASATRMFRLATVQNSYMAYHKETGHFTDGSVVLGDLEDVEEIVRDAFGTGFATVSERSFSPEPILAGRMMPSVSNISPLAVSAGVDDVITINGNGFGNATGTVLFDSPDDGIGGGYTIVSNSNIVSWTNARILVRVVSEAGSGNVIIRASNGQQAVSSQQIDVDFALTNLNLSNGEIVTPRLVDDEADGNGGYIFRVSDNSNNGGRSLAGDAPAFAALTRAINTWQTDGDFNVSLQGTTNIQVPSRDDDVNIISYGSNAFDFDVELGAGTVGIAYSYYSACGSSEFEVTGLDILFRRPGNPNGFGGSVNYNFGPGVGGGTDFESVALHELGHAHQLNHVADASEVMAFSITQGQNQRILSTDTRAGADEVANLALSYSPPIINCGGDFNQARDYVTFSAAGGALPVTWAEFTATSHEKTVDLLWGTAAESENDFFTIERSADGENFRPLAEVAARNLVTGANYSATDQSPLPGMSYYRIAQTDFSGSRTFSDIRQVSRSTAGEVILYPNPVTNFLTITDTEADAGSRYGIYDGLGRRVMTTRPIGSSGQLTVDLSQLAAGQYVLLGRSGQSRRFVK